MCLSLSLSLLKMLYFTVSLTLYFRHILACSRFIQPYLFLLRHARACYKRRTPAYLGTLCFRYIQSYNVRHIEVYLPTFGYILVDSGILRVLAQLDMFMYIKAYSELTAYSDIFRTADLFSQFQTLLKSSSCIF